MAAEILVLAGVNGAGKSSVGGAAFEAAGGVYYNADRATEQYMEAGLALAEANAGAWRRGVQQLDHAIRSSSDYAFETTLGGRTVTRRLIDATAAGHHVRIWYVGLASPDLHIERVLARVSEGGHDIPIDRIRSRWMTSRENLVRLLPHIHELAIYDNSTEARLKEAELPAPIRLLHARGGAILELIPATSMPSWARPIVAATLKLWPPL